MKGDPNDGWTRVVSRRLSLGRLLPLGGAADGSWIAERAAAAVLIQAAGESTGLLLGQLRIAAADPDAGGRPALLPPPGALPPGPLRIEAEADAMAGTHSLPAAADRLRHVLFAACADRLGLTVTEVDVRVIGLLDTPATRRSTIAPDRAMAGTRGLAVDAATGVPGVARLTGVLGSPVHIADDHVRVELAVARGYRALDVTLAVRRAVAKVVAGKPSVGVLVTEVELS